MNIKKAKILSGTLLIFLAAIIVSCGTQKNQLVGVAGKNKHKPFTDYGMVFIPSGSFVMGVKDDKFLLHDAQQKRVSLSEFYIDKSEITFKEYREFVKYVMDSIPLDEEDDKSAYIYENPETNEKTPIYPDISVWKRNFPKSQITSSEYFERGDPDIDQYPVVGINWNQAVAFTVWRTHKMNIGAIFSLPTEAQWEYAAKGGIRDVKYPWIGDGTKNDADFYLANFYPMQGDYVSDGRTYTLPVQEYAPNGFGLYDMAGNVAEWVLDSYYPRSYDYTNNHNPLYIDINSDYKVTRGGSWISISYFLQNGARDWAHKDSTYSYVGFRCIASYTGTQRSPHAPDPERDIPSGHKIKGLFKKD